MLPAGVGAATVLYRLGISAFVGEGEAGHDWDALSRLPVRHFEIGTLHGSEVLHDATGALRPLSFGVHWPLYASDGQAYELLASPPGTFAALLSRMRDRVAGTGARYLLVHLAQRREVWPEDEVVTDRLRQLAALAAELAVEVVLEPKESVARGDGLSGYVTRAPRLPAGLAMCLDTNDWASARRHLGRGPDCLAGRAAYFHLHAMHVRPDGGGLYLHAPPWVGPGGDPPWPDVKQPEGSDLDVMAERGRPVTVQIEVHPRYRARMPGAIAAVRSQLAGLGWRETDL